MHLTIIAYASRLDWDIERAVFRVDGRSDPLRRFARCQERSQLQWIVNEVVNESNQKVARLDIFGHGKSGTLTLGDQGQEVVTQHEASWDLFPDLKTDDLLTDNAEVRLLGCDTGTLAEGRAVLEGLEAKLSKGGKTRTVWGSLASIAHSDFGPEGFREEVASKFLRTASRMSASETGVRRLGGIAENAAVNVQGVMQLLPPGYVLDGLEDMPAGIVDERFPVNDLIVTLCVDRRVVAIKSKSSNRIAVYRWTAGSQAPSREQIKAHLPAH
nr:DUF4347 domain-containing protein [Myxococcus sp. CA033]